MIKYIATILFILCFSQVALSQSWLYGKWKGRGAERGGSTWSIRLEASKEKFRIEYPSLKCGGEWRIISFSKYQARFREDIKFNREACEPTGNVTIKRLSDGRLLFNYSYNGSRKLDASATLIRIK